MTREEILADIYASIERGIAASMVREREERFTTADETDIEKRIADIINEARCAARGSYRVFETFRSRISEIAKNSRQYESAIFKLAEVLHV